MILAERELKVTALTLGDPHSGAGVLTRLMKRSTEDEVTATMEGAGLRVTLGVDPGTVSLGQRVRLFIEAVPSTAQAIGEHFDRER